MFHSIVLENAIMDGNGLENIALGTQELLEHASLCVNLGAQMVRFAFLTTKGALQNVLQHAHKANIMTKVRAHVLNLI